MELIGRLHPLLTHFPIALVIVAVAAETAAAVTGDERWHTVAVGNLRAGAAFAVITAVAGWRLAAAPLVASTSLLEWHRWLGTTATGMTIAAALTTAGARRRAPLEVWTYRTALLGAGIFVAVAGHLGGLLVWGADFMRP